MLLFNRKPFFEMDEGLTGSANFGTPPEPAPVSPDPAGAQPPDAPPSEFAQYMGKDLTSYPEEMRPVIIERLKEMDSAFTPAMQKFKPWSQLAEEGLTPDQARQAVALQRTFNENPEKVYQLLQAVMPKAQPSTGAPAATAAQDDPLAFYEETYGTEFTAPLRQIHEAANKANQRAEQLEQQLQTERTTREKEANDAFITRAESSMVDWLKTNQHYGIRPEDYSAFRTEAATIAGERGIRAGLSPKDFEAAALRTLGPEKYGDIIYNQRLAAARGQVAKTAPGPVPKPGVAAGSVPEKGPGFDSSREMLDGAVEFMNALVRQGGG